MSEPQYQERFSKALDRLMREIDNLRTEQAAIAAYREVQSPRNRFLTTAFIALLGDPGCSGSFASLRTAPKRPHFFYLHRCAPQRMKNLNIERLQNFSGRLKAVRNLTFVHLDRNGIFDSVTSGRSPSSA